MDQILKLSMRWKESRNVFFRAAGSVLGIIPKLYVRYLESKKNEELERELDRRQEETWDRIVEDLKKKKK
ncbi:MAG: hypothetical protein ACI4EO_08840 [Blautia sp.]